MPLNGTRKMNDFRNFEDAAAHILQLLSQQMNINTLFIAKNDGQTNHIVKAINAEEELVTEGGIAPLEQTFCSLSIDYGEKPLVIEDISIDASAQRLEISSSFNNGSFIGIPIYRDNGEVYGTICAMDNVPFEFTEEHQRSLELMSSLLTYVLELESAQEQIQSLSSPLVPVADGIAILPVIGNVTARRAQTIIDRVLGKCAEAEVRYLVVDVSGVSQINSVVGEYLLKLVNTLKIIGVVPVITGIQPFMALKVPHFAEALSGILIEANLQTALRKLGFQLSNESKEKSGRR
ncbi:GAF domain-containing protein [Planococcus chinensis]|uniref:GAF domain-containing protein n=1 Tax=Planococcus chinensis TaxID=272917 RepID=A0ABW4QL56_9BACL